MTDPEYQFLKRREALHGRYEARTKIKTQCDIAYFEKFGDEDHAVENVIRYERLRFCGYTHEEAFRFDDSGWIITNYGNKHKTERVAKTKKAFCDIHTFQLPNGNWGAGCTYLASSSSGYGSNPSIYDKQFKTEREAKRGEILYVIRMIEEGYDEPVELLPQLKKAAADSIQLSLF